MEYAKRTLNREKAMGRRYMERMERELVINRRENYIPHRTHLLLDVACGMAALLGCPATRLCVWCERGTEGCQSASKAAYQRCMPQEYQQEPLWANGDGAPNRKETGSCARKDSVDTKAKGGTCSSQRAHKSPTWPTETGRQGERDGIVRKEKITGS